MNFTDDYCHETPGIMYLPKCLRTKEVEELYDYALEGCKCEAECRESNGCSCLNRSGTSYAYNDVNWTKNYFLCEKDARRPTYECNEDCKCNGHLCGNRLVQLGPRKGLKVRPCQDASKGLGLFTLEQIPKGSFVCEYAGKIITESEAFKRFKEHSKQNKMNYIFCIKEQFGDRTTKTFIDPTYYGNIGRYINHSCEPTCKLLPVRVNDVLPLLGIFANEDIEENTEITYDYGEGDPGFEQSTGFARKNCLCNSTNCRKYLPFNVTLQS